MRLEIALQPKQKILWEHWDGPEFTRIGSGGSRGGAKSGGARRCMLLRRLRYPNTPGLLLRRTYPDLYKSHIVKLFEEYPALREFWREQSKELKLPNGSRLFFGSAEHPGDLAAFYSAEFADIVPDEAQEWSQGELESLAGSLRCTSNQDIQPKMVFPFMPGVGESGIPPTGLPYLKRVFVDGEIRGHEAHQQWTFVRAFAWDNIEWSRKALENEEFTEDDYYAWTDDQRRDYFLTRTEYGATLNSITNAAKREAWLYGKFDMFQGQYFNFDRARHVISIEEALKRIKPWHKRWASGDWGYDHPHDIQWHSEDEFGRVLTYREIWGREVGEEQLGAKVTSLDKLDTQRRWQPCKAFPFSWDAGKQSKRSSRQFPKSIVQLFNDALGAGIPKAFPADSSPGSRMAGWRLMSQLLDATAGPEGQETPMWQIVEGDTEAEGMGCNKLIECIPSLVRDPDNTEDVLKVDWTENQIGDDPADANRMGIQFMVKPSEKPFQVRLQEKLVKIPIEGSGRYIAHLEMSKKERESGGAVFYLNSSVRRRRR
jgi:hypothetical protein